VSRSCPETGKACLEFRRRKKALINSIEKVIDQFEKYAKLHQLVIQHVGKFAGCLGSK